ncbi:PREDICTED: uncharacterized protein LOC105556423 [Vollenhovia emeryi]|uniref:uncharacterized protein LOC105556423 n=1 Tax=Vollenhovia emeryi TaxID=411798 RepID=UPI0005F41A2B|nr:PREDICTED: uncharacterized protein LOC105556423 [Vollenhovia emeryi]
MKEVRVLKQSRARCIGNVTRILTYLDSDEPKNVNDAQVRLARLSELWNRFEEIQNELVEARPEASKAELEAIQAENEAEGQLFEVGYYKAAARLQQIITEATRADRAAQTPQPVAERNQQQRRSKPKLPEIKLPEFSGDFTKWIFFKNSFETTIHSDPDLTPMQKHQYLVGQLQGEARQVIQGFTISDENYENAWELLTDTYDNTMLIIETHLEA